ncbi:MAG TPA: hypothetical protein VEJ40_02780 [Pseudolabrys sp.]|nr:hypothetical protein [Pseudolabrys sp.]
MAKAPSRVSIDTLVDLACRDGVEIRPTLLRVLTDLYVQKPVHDADEERQYVELALNLVDAVDSQTRSAVAVTLSTYPNAPAAVLRKLGGAPRTAAPGTQENEPAAHKPAAHVRSELIDLFFTADSEERRLILRNIDVAPGPTAQRTLPVAGELLRRLENAALTRNVGEFARVLERALGVSADVATRIARDDSGEPVVVALKAIGMHPDVLARILMFLNPVVGQSAQRIYELAQLHEEVSMAAAERMLAIWRTSMPPRRADLVRQVRAVIQGTTGRGLAPVPAKPAPTPAPKEREIPAAPPEQRPAAQRLAAQSPAVHVSAHAANGAAPALQNPASAPPGRHPDSPADDLGFWWERHDVFPSSMWGAWSTADGAEPAAQDRTGSTVPAERAAPAAHVAGQARAHAAAGIRTRYLTHDTVYWNDELPGARAGSTPSSGHAPADHVRERRIKTS